MAHSDSREKLALTEQQSLGERWYVLDNAASFMPGITNRSLSLVFRISITLTETVQIDVLAKAMERINPRFPYFLVELRRGLFWYYFDPLKKPVKPVADSNYPCLGMPVLRRQAALFRVRAYHNRIAVEFCHALSDGTGALSYLKALLLQYYTLLGVQVADPMGIFLPDETPKPEESEDAFHRYFKEKVPFPNKDKNAFHRPGLVLLPGNYRVTSGVLALEAAQAKAKELGCTLNELLVAVYFACQQDLFYALPTPIRKSMSPIIAVQVPVNLRRFFPSGTMRNFSLYVLPSLDTRLGFYDFTEILKRVRSHMQAELNEKNLSRPIARNVIMSKNIGVRILPLFLKDVAARIVYRRLGEDTYSGFVSNLGLINLPLELAEHIERIDFIPTPSYRCRTNANVSSWGNKLIINFGSVAATTELERLSLPA